MVLRFSKESNSSRARFSSPKAWINAERSTAMDERLGHDLGHYRLLRLLGTGSFASVYLGEHRYLGRQAALKVLHLRLEEASFLQEARTIARLEHPHIIRVLDFGIEE